MGPKAEEAIAAMLNCFPQTSQNYELLLASLDKLCAGLSDRAIIEAAERYAGGKVHNQSMTYAPSAPLIVQEATRRQNFIELSERPRLTSQRPTRADPRPPFMVRQQQAWSKHAHRPVLFEEVGHDRWRQLSASRQIPAGAVWVAALGIVFGPEPGIKQQAAE